MEKPDSLFHGRTGKGKAYYRSALAYPPHGSCDVNDRASLLEQMLAGDHAGHPAVRNVLQWVRA